MKPIEYCLDKVLQELKKSWDEHSRPPLNSTNLLQEFEVPQERHEFFKGIINKLVDDGNADFLDEIKDQKAASLETYEQRTIITASGYYCIKVHGGYTE